MSNLSKVAALGALVTIGLVGFASSAKAEISLLAGESTLDESELISQEPRLVLACAENEFGEVALVNQIVQDYAHPYNTVLMVKTEILEQGEPNIVFTKTLDSDHSKGAYTPESRCQALRDRFTNLQNSIGVDQLANLSRVGKVNGQRVIAVNKVSRDTVVMTLSGDNAKWKVAQNEVLPKFQALVDTPFVPAAPGFILE